MDPVHTAFLHALSSGYQFTAAFGQVPEMEWQERPFGMIYVATRRVGDLVWVRVADFMAPNVHQFTREIEEAGAERVGHRPVIIRWAVPNDDTHTTNFELAQVDPAWGLDADADRAARLRPVRRSPVRGTPALPGGLRRAVEPAPHRRPRPRAPGLDRPRRDHAAPDRARRYPRGGPRRGSAPDRLCRQGIIATVTQDSVITIAANPDPVSDRALLRETGRRVVAGEYQR